MEKIDMENSFIPVPGEVGAAVVDIARRLDMVVGAVLLGVHARVVAALTGDGEVLTGCVGLEGESGDADVARPLPYLVSLPGGSWERLMCTAAAARPMTDGRPPVTTVLDLTGRVPDALPAEVTLWTGAEWDGPTLRLRLRHRAAEGSHPNSADRLAGYYLTALRALADDVTAPYEESGLLSVEELHQLRAHGAGPIRELPDKRLHELFEERVRRHPDAVAVRQGGTSLTYTELNRRANRIGHALRARGLGGGDREDVVAVVTERNLEWVTAALAIFKAGCVYLPIEPHFPPDRIAAMLGRSGCATVLTERTSDDGLRHAVTAGLDVELLHLDAVAVDEDANPGVPVAAGQLAYIYFTSGSTGEPKGAMCEHAGMLNHMLAKVEDLGIGPDDVVAQTAPQCFDISLWQLFAALLVGGTTVVVEQEAVLDVRRFATTLLAQEVTVAQLVPSYLEVLLTHLEHETHGLGRLSRVSVTGEALSKALTVRWFAAYPGIALMNAYGLTETSDDTNHEVMRRPPETERVPLGRPVRNVTVAVVDERLRPVPLGAPGEIVFSGVCVGRGYINDPDRTRRAFLADPDRPGERLYCSGDFGRWLPDGRLEFLGRRDSQVKIRGFRVETGEVENHLLRVAGIREAAVVVVDLVGGRSLAAYYVGTPTAEEVHLSLAATLPEYMIPDSLHPLDALPLTDNGKTDTKALRALSARPPAEGPAGGVAAEPPLTTTERRVARVWARVLGVTAEQVGRSDNFFERGGTSLAALRLVLQLDQTVTLREVTTWPVLADLAAAIDARGTGVEQAEPVAG
jgi:amino acid adenylation domain-containing protein